MWSIKDISNLFRTSTIKKIKTSFVLKALIPRLVFSYRLWIFEHVGLYSNIFYLERTYLNVYFWLTMTKIETLRENISDTWNFSLKVFHLK